MLAATRFVFNTDSNPKHINHAKHASHASVRLLPACMVCCCLQDNPQLDAVWRLLQYYWNQHYQGIWQALQGYQWSPQVRCWMVVKGLC
jgi:hypothetical protein